MEGIGLKEAVAALREELTESILAGTNKDLRFQVGEISLEIKVQVERVREGAGGLKFWVLEVGAKASLSSTTTHTITIPLKPVSGSGQPILTGIHGGIIPD